MMVQITIQREKTSDAAAIAMIVDAVVGRNSSLSFNSAVGSTEVDQSGEVGVIYLAEFCSETASAGTLDFDTRQGNTTTLRDYDKSSHGNQGIVAQLAKQLLGYARARGFQCIMDRLPAASEPALSLPPNNQWISLVHQPEHGL